MSNIKEYKYDWIWQKNVPTGFQHAKNMPMKDYEIISVFSAAGMGHANLLGNNRMTYNPQGLQSCHIIENGQSKFNNTVGKRPSHKEVIVREHCNYPRMIINFDSQAGEGVNNDRIHPHTEARWPTSLSCSDLHQRGRHRARQLYGKRHNRHCLSP